MGENLAGLLKELQLWMDLRREQGADISAVEDGIRREADRSIAVLKALSSPADFPYHEPNDLAAIRAARPTGPRVLPFQLSEEEWHDRALGAWVGRSAGCMLGIPVEGQDRTSVEGFARLLNNYPLNRYWPAVPRPRAHYGEPIENFLLEKIDHVGMDDDLAYTVIGLVAMEKFGPNFTSRQLGELWVERLPRACTAEHVALENMKKGIWPPESARVNNPYCEWIGAAIRADIWGYLAPCWPEKAAEFAYRDAVISHERNGVYSEMFFSALMAAAFAEKDLERLIRIALSEIPSRCRFAEMVQDTLGWCKEDRSWEQTWERVMAKYGRYHPVHSINNAAFVLLALWHGQGDFTKTISISVMCGLDTDCNGATAGSIAGILLGEKAIPRQWKDCFHDTLISYVRGEERNSLTGLARRTCAAAVKPPK